MTSCSLLFFVPSDVAWGYLAAASSNHLVLLNRILEALRLVGLGKCMPFASFCHLGLASFWAPFRATPGMALRVLLYTQLLLVRGDLCHGALFRARD